MRHRLTPTTAIALIALFVSLGGGALAASKLITGKQIKDHSIGLSDLSPAAIKALAGHDGAPGPQGPAGPTGPAGAAGATGAAGAPGANATSYWAIVDATGTLVKGSGVTAVSGGSSLGVTTYRIDFTRNVHDCARIATVGDADYPSFSGGTTAGHAVTSIDSTYPNRVIVSTTSPTGGAAYKPFSVAVFC